MGKIPILRPKLHPSPPHQTAFVITASTPPISHAKFRVRAYRKVTHTEGEYLQCSQRFLTFRASKSVRVATAAPGQVGVNECELTVAVNTFL